MTNNKHIELREEQHARFPLSSTDYSEQSDAIADFWLTVLDQALTAQAGEIRQEERDRVEDILGMTTLAYDFVGYSDSWADICSFINNELIPSLCTKAVEGVISKQEKI